MSLGKASRVLTVAGVPWSSGVPRVGELGGTRKKLALSLEGGRGPFVTARGQSSALSGPAPFRVTRVHVALLHERLELS